MESKSKDSSSIKYYLLIFLIILNLVRSVSDISLTEILKLEENKNLRIIESILDSLIIVITIYLFITAKLNLKLTLLLVIILICIFIDYLIDRKAIYYFINKDKKTEELMKYLDEKANLSLILGIIVFLVSIYILSIIFSFK